MELENILSEDPDNPFSLRPYAGPESFCDREKELKDLVLNCTNGLDTTLIADRKIGKTGLVLRFVDELNRARKRKAACVYVDLYATHEFQDLVKLTIEAALAAFPEPTTLGQRILKFLRTLRPIIMYDILTGAPQVTLDYKSDLQKIDTLKALYAYLDSLDMTVVIAYDEFQQIREYPEKNVEAILRTNIQTLKKVHFIYSGSRRDMMVDIFTNPKNPFFSSTVPMHLGKIERGVYADFIEKRFAKGGTRIDADALDFILDWTERKTFYTQRLCNALYYRRFGHIDIDRVKMVCADILNGYADTALLFRQLLPTGQWELLRAIAKDGKARSLLGRDFISRHKLGQPASVRKAAAALYDKEFLLRQPAEEEGKSVYELQDIWLAKWLEWKG